MCAIEVNSYSIMITTEQMKAARALLHWDQSELAERADIGGSTLKRIEARARAQGLQSIFVLTTRTMHWFIKRGFVQVNADWLPEARKRKYNWDRKSQVLVKKLS